MPLGVLISASTSIGVAAATEGEARGVANVPSINIRAGSSVSYEILGTASEGDVFTVHAKVGDWHRVTLDNQYAYIFSDFLTITEGAPNESHDESDESNGETSSIPIPQMPMPMSSAPQTEADSSGEDVPDFATLLNSIWDVAEEPEPESTASTPAPSNVELPVFENFNLNITNPDIAEAFSRTFVPQDDVYAIVSSPTGLNLRESPSTEADVVTILYPLQTLNVYDIITDWAHVSTLEGYSGYVSTEFITVRSGERQAPPEPNAEKAQQVVDFARQFIGTPYVSGGSDLSMGVDCSGFVFSVMSEFDISLGRSSRDMINSGAPVDRENIAPGDLIFFSANGTVVTHVALYIGDNQFIHSTDTRGLGVSFASLTSDHSQQTYFGARRVIE